MGEAMAFNGHGDFGRQLRCRGRLIVKNRSRFGRTSLDRKSQLLLESC
jgi:hypothetical protein